MSTADPQEHTKEVLRLIEADHDATTDFIARLINLQTTTRTVAVTTVSALAGLAVANHSWPLALAGIPVLIIALVSEARNGFLLEVAHQRSTSLERTIQSYIGLLVETGTPVEAEAKDRLRGELDHFEFGISRSLRNVPWKGAIRRAAKRATAWLYIVLVVLLVLASFSTGT